MSNRNSRATAGVLAALLCAAAGHGADDPSWWTSRNVIAADAPAANDYAAVNAGQLKWFATNAYDELGTSLPGGAGTGVLAVIQSLGLGDNYCGINLGQLKAVAKPFHDRLKAVNCYTNAWYLPWTECVSDDQDYAAANLGQLKTVFTFDPGRDTDGDGLADWIETDTGIFVSPEDTGTDPNDADSDYDGVEDGDEVAARTDPNNSDTSPPLVTIDSPEHGQGVLWMP